ncbi:MAG: hypothetical protein PHS95_00660 [Candidatus Pacebacteria bacterium]|nr:hypothetical protein [Candidatus Paceibacterota bacterium]
MGNYSSNKRKSILTNRYFWFFVGFVAFIDILFSVATNFSDNNIFTEKKEVVPAGTKIVKKIFVPKKIVLDTALYDLKMNKLANYKVSTSTEPTATSTTATSTKPRLWPAKTVYPNAGALLPFNRIVAYYGNLYSTRMGVLGEYPEDEMLAKLQAEVEKWNTADPETPAIPALHYIAVTAQMSKGEDGKYRLRMPDSQIDKVLAMASKINAIVFLDVQVGLSNVQTEIPLLEKYLKMPNVHLGIDPEFSMKTGAKPGTVVGTFDAEDINFVANYLADIVKQNNLTPKIFVVHRYTEAMVTNYRKIKPLPEVQIVMDMDGWGGKERKLDTYEAFIYQDPVQFTGFKLFYKNDVLTPGTTLMTPNDLLRLIPRPIYIQYQ